jgi:hypothetical protein
MRTLALALLIGLTVLLTACNGPAVLPVGAPQTSEGDVFYVALPRLIVHFDAQGYPEVEGIPLEAIAGGLGLQIDLNQYQINPYYPAWMTAANIQHVELRQFGDGIALLVNGELMPSLSFKDGALERIVDLAPLLGPNANTGAIEEMALKFAPLVTRLGLSLVFTFPPQDGVAAIPLADVSADLGQLAVRDVKPADAEAQMQFELRYDAQGAPSFLGVTPAALTMLGLKGPNSLQPEQIQLLQASNIQHIQVRSKTDGLYIFINGMPLPNLVWDSESLTQAIDVYTRMNSSLSKELLNLVRMLAPALSATDISVMVHFPLAPGAEAIPAQMQ